MKVRHRVVVESLCPINGDADRYIADVSVWPGGFLACEAVLAAVQELVREPITQEELTQRLADRLGCLVRTRGSHCRGRVKTVVVCRPRHTLPVTAGHPR
jgi:hypothetical protein